MHISSWHDECHIQCTLAHDNYITIQTQLKVQYLLTSESDHKVLCYSPSKATCTWYLVDYQAIKSQSLVKLVSNYYRVEKSITGCVYLKPSKSSGQQNHGSHILLRSVGSSLMFKTPFMSLANINSDIYGSIYY